MKSVWRVALLIALALGCETGRSDGHSRDQVHASPSPKPAPQASSSERPAPPLEKGRAPPRERGTAAGLHYLTALRGGAQAGEAVPMVVIIHGLGDRAHDRWIDDSFDVPVRLVMPQAPEPYHGGFAWFDARVRDDAPERLARGITRAADRLARVLQVLQKKYPTEGKPIAVGFSQGGMLAYALALHHPERVRAAMPLSGMLPRPLWPEDEAQDSRPPPVRATHGDADTVVPIEADRELVRHLRALGYDAELQEIPGMGHRPWLGDGLRALLQ